MPPLVPLVAGLAYRFGGSPFGARLLPALAAALTIVVVAALARELGARPFAQVVAAVATALMPASLFFGNTLTTTSFEPLTWTAVIFFSVRLARKDGALAWGGLALTIAVASYAKYSIFLLVLALAAGAAVRREIRLGLLISAAGVAALLLLAPNIAWQWSHGFPIVEVLRGDALRRHALHGLWQVEYSNPIPNAGTFAVEQLLYTGPLSAPLWMCGLSALFRRAALRDVAFVGIAYAIAVCVALLALAKGYYLIGLYPALFAVGATTLDSVRPAVQRAYAAVLAAGGLAAAPLALPVLPAEGLISYMHAFGAPRRLVQPLFANEFGWERLTRTVASQYGALPRNVRDNTPIFADTFAEAGAIEFYGGRYDLPEPISAKDQYYFWGPRGYSLDRMLVVGASEFGTLRLLYRHVRMLGTFVDRYRSALEGPTPIYFCSGPRVSRGRIWYSLRWFGEYGAH